MKNWKTDLEPQENKLIADRSIHFSFPFEKSPATSSRDLTSNPFLRDASMPQGELSWRSFNQSKTALGPPTWRPFWQRFAPVPWNEWTSYSGSRISLNPKKFKMSCLQGLRCSLEALAVFFKRFLSSEGFDMRTFLGSYFVEVFQGSKPFSTHVPLPSPLPAHVSRRSHPCAARGIPSDQPKSHDSPGGEKDLHSSQVGSAREDLWRGHSPGSSVHLSFELERKLKALHKSEKTDWILIEAFSLPNPSLSSVAFTRLFDTSQATHRTSRALRSLANLAWLALCSSVACLACRQQSASLKNVVRPMRFSPK